MKAQWYTTPQTSHYHLGPICSQCLEYFTTSMDTMHHHSQLCKLALAGIDNGNNQGRNLTLMIMVRTMMTSHLARISTAPSNSHHQQSGCSYHSTLVFMPGLAPAACPQ